MIVVQPKRRAKEDFSARVVLVLTLIILKQMMISDSRCVYAVRIDVRPREVPHAKELGLHAFLFARLTTSQGGFVGHQ